MNFLKMLQNFSLIAMAQNTSPEIITKRHITRQNVLQHHFISM